MANNIQDMKVGDIFSESSHYVLKGTGTDGITLHHMESGEDVSLSTDYVANLLKSADQFQSVVKVGKEDKYWTKKQIEALNGITDPVWAAANGLTTELPKEGDIRVKGIRSLFESIHSSQVFMLCYRKVDKPLSDKKLKELKDSQVASAWAAIEQAQKSKKGVANIAKQVLSDIQNNPILPYEPGESRILRGYKIQFTSRDGRYDCVDMDFPDGFGQPNIRPVNINTLEYIVLDGVKYEVE